MKDFLVSIKENKLITISALFVLIFCKLNFTNTEFAVYESYNRSIAYDFDLNITNQFFFEDDVKLLTPTGYYYSHHNYGSALLQSPFFIYAHTLGEITGLDRTFNINAKERPESLGKSLKPFNYHASLEDFETKAAAIGNILIFMVSLFLLIQEFSGRYRNEDETSFSKSVILFVAAGPALFYLLFAQSTPNLTILFPIYLLFKYSKNLDLDKNNFLLGLSFGLGFCIRHDFAIYGLFILLWWFLYKPTIKKLILQASGLFLFIIPAFIHEYNKLGHLHFGYLDTFYFNLSTLRDLYFSSYGGIFLVHPALFILIIISIWILFKVKENKRFKLELASVLAVFIIKTALLGLTFSHNGGVLGGRQIIQEFILLSIFVSMHLPYRRLFTLFISFLAIFNFIISVIYNNEQIFKTYFFQYSETVTQYFSRIISNIPHAITPKILFNIYENAFVLLNFSVVIFLILFLLFKFKNKIHYYLYFLLIFNISLIISDSINGKNPDGNSYELRSSSMNVLMYYENMGSILERLKFLSIRRDKKDEELIRFSKLARDYNNIAIKESNTDRENLFHYFEAIGVSIYKKQFKELVHDVK